MTNGTVAPWQIRHSAFGIFSAFFRHLKFVIGHWSFVI